MATYALPDLPYDYAALEPVITGEILELHHSKHHAAYVKGANDTLERIAETMRFDPQSGGIVRGPLALPGIGLSLLLTAGCAGQATSTTPAATSTYVRPAATVNVRTMKPGRPPDPPPTLTRASLTASDNGAVVITRAGQEITIGLPGSWDRPRVSDTRILHLVSVTGGYPATSGLQATLVAVGHGQAEIVTETDMACLHAHPACLPPQQLWRVQIEVR